MRYQILKLKRNNSTKAERRFVEILKRNHIPFRAKVKICGREVDFLVGNICIEIGNHSQDIEKNKKIIENGYSLLFISNKEIADDIKRVENHLIKDWLKS